MAVDALNFKRVGVAPEHLAQRAQHGDQIFIAAHHGQVADEFAHGLEPCGGYAVALHHLHDGVVADLLQQVRADQQNFARVRQNQIRIAEHERILRDVDGPGLGAAKHAARHLRIFRKRAHAHIQKRRLVGHKAARVDMQVIHHPSEKAHLSLIAHGRPSPRYPFFPSIIV